jgi:hypothetical protein
MLDKSLLFEHFSRRNDYGPAAEVQGEYLARTRAPIAKRAEIARALCEGYATVANLTPAQIAWLCRVPRSAICARYRKPKPKKPIVLRDVWRAAPIIGERQDLLVDEIVLPLAD